MKKKKALIALAVTTLIVIILLISLRAYYAVIALLVGTLLMRHREIWSLIKKRKLPPIDERVRENTGKSIRNGFIFLVSALVFLMLPFSVRIIEAPNTVHVLGGLVLSSGAVYLFSYLFYDRVKPGLEAGRLKMLRIFLLVAGISVTVFIISVFLHNLISGLFAIEEPVFFIIAVFVSPLAVAVGLIGSLVMFIKGLFSRDW